MIIPKTTMNIIDFVNTLEEDAKLQSKRFEGTDNVNYSYAFGWLTGTFKSTLIQLELSDEQLARLNDIIKILV